MSLEPQFFTVWEREEYLREKAKFDQAVKEKVRIARLEDALVQIRDQHIGDCPASLAHLSDEEWARRCHGHLRSIAREALEDGE